nr:hypothetical protein 13 [Balneolaceae bacterium]
MAFIVDPAFVGEVIGLGAGTGVLLALAAVPGGTITEKDYVDNASDLLERSVDDIVVLYKPDRFPLTTMMQNMKSAKQAKARKEEWVEVGYHARKTTVSGATSAGTGGNAVTLSPSDIDMWGINDKVYVPSVTVGSPAVPARLLVVDKDAGAGEIDVICLNDTNVPAISDATEIIRLGRAAAADDAQTSAHGARGTLLWNYCETFMGQFEIEKLVKKIGTYQNDSVIQEDLEMYDFRNNRENARLFGARAKVFDPVKQKDIYTTGGVETFIGKSATYSQGQITQSEWIDLTKKIFSGDAGSEERLLIGGNEFIASVLKVDSVQKQIENTQTELYLGVKVPRIETTFGTLLLKWHKGFDENSRNHDAFALDMNHIHDLILEPMEETELELDKTGQKRVDATRVLETAALQVRYPDTHCEIIGT